MPKINAATIDEHKEQTRAALLEAGADAFVQFGLAGTSIGTLADNAGIARTTVYEYFANKEAVLMVLIDERLPPIIAKLITDLPDPDPADGLSEILRRGFEVVAEYPAEATLMFRVSRELPKLERDDAWLVFAEVRSEIVRLCREGIESGQFPNVDPTSLGTIVADHLIGGIDELSARDSDEATAIVESRVSFLRHGLGSLE